MQRQMILAVGIRTVLNEIVLRDTVCPRDVGIQAVIQKTMNMRLSQTILSQLCEDGTITDDSFEISR